MEALKDPRRQPAVLPQFSAPILAPQYISLYRWLITSSAPLENAKVSASINVGDLGKAVSMKLKDRVSTLRCGEEEHERI